MPENVLGQMNMNRFIKMYGDMGITVQIFSDPDKALNWLKSQ
jgi:hypothetical protein